MDAIIKRYFAERRVRDFAITISEDNLVGFGRLLLRLSQHFTSANSSINSEIHEFHFLASTNDLLATKQFCISMHDEILNARLSGPFVYKDLNVLQEYFFEYCPTTKEDHA